MSEEERRGCVFQFVVVVVRRGGGRLAEGEERESWFVLRWEGGGEMKSGRYRAGSEGRRRSMFGGRSPGSVDGGGAGRDSRSPKS